MDPVRRTLVRLLAAALCALAPLAGCSAPAPPVDAQVRRAVADWAAAPPQRLSGIPLEGWSYEVTSVRQEGARAYAHAELRYRLAGYDTAPAGSARELVLTRDGSRTAWRVTDERPSPGAPEQLWDQPDPVAVVRGAHSLVLGVRQSPQTLSEIAAEADRAVPAVSAAWPGPWARRVVVLVPASLDAMAALLGRPADTYRGMGAVTTGATGRGPAPADRVVVNPAGYAELSQAGRQIVLTHETTHVATRAATSARTPQWLSEGFADWAAYRDSAPAPAEAAPTLARAVRLGDLPPALPADEAFAFGGDQEAMARAYEGAWLACRLVAARWGDAALVRLYELAGREPLPAALDQALGTDLPGLTKAWQQTLREDLR
ncbi:hypothetical protein [Streptomyces katrae]|uniref:Lipoprotein n=1 Tax=Streptomyces katrae TaxID=68223 RepID=A0A0F4JS91_9ACTN|nr:hypothetical protein [Streptomyces katrae]KJY35821.1 hypothetical protein VR44_09060 [Streptomyces katrae]